MAVKSQAIADLLAQFPRKEEGPLSEEIPGEVAVTEIPGRKWTIRFDRSATENSNGVGIVLSCENGTPYLCLSSLVSRALITQLNMRHT